MSAYVIYQGDVLDPERYEQYKTAAATSIVEAGGRYLVRGGGIDVLEGDGPAGRVVVVEFPTKQAALNWYESETYTSARKIRDGAVIAQMFIVDGVD